MDDKYGRLRLLHRSSYFAGILQKYPLFFVLLGLKIDTHHASASEVFGGFRLKGPVQQFATA